MKYFQHVLYIFKNVYLYSFDTVPLNAKYIDMVDHSISKIDVIKMFPVITHLLRCLKSKKMEVLSRIDRIVILPSMYRSYG